MAKRSIRPIRIDGNLAYVPLTQGYEAVIDAADVPLVAEWAWCAKMGRNTVYAMRRDYSGVKPRDVLMHRAIMGNPAGFEIDHIDGDGLNNCRANLRLATHQQNMRNQRTRSDNTSCFKGVDWNKRDLKWQARIGLNGKRVSLGYFDTPEAAYAAYCSASAELHGQFGRMK